MSRELGQDVEAKAASYLAKQGFLLIEKNYHCRAGEIDLIGKQDQHLVFVEVRYRKSSFFGSAAESVTTKKQQRILMTAQHFLLNNLALQNLCCRFDVIACEPKKNGLMFNWIKGAFTG